MEFLQLRLRTVLCDAKKPGIFPDNIMALMSNQCLLSLTTPSATESVTFVCKNVIIMVPLFNPQWKSVMQVWSLCAVRAPYGDEPVFLGAFAKLRNTPISLVMLVLPSVCPHGTTRLPPDGFS